MLQAAPGTVLIVAFALLPAKTGEVKLTNSKPDIELFKSVEVATGIKVAVDVGRTVDLSLIVGVTACVTVKVGREDCVKVGERVGIRFMSEGFTAETKTTLHNRQKEQRIKRPKRTIKSFPKRLCFWKPSDREEKKCVMVCIFITLSLLLILKHFRSLL